jgi:hypothetical protein
MPNLLCNDLKAAVKSIVGTCVSLGVLVENKPASQVGLDIDNGVYDKEIKEERTQISSEKKKLIENYFNDLSNKQLQDRRQELRAAVKLRR